jgi:hypothetical protein
MDRLTGDVEPFAASGEHTQGCAGPQQTLNNQRARINHVLTVVEDEHGLPSVQELSQYLIWW